MDAQKIKEIDKKINSITKNISSKYDQIRELEEKRNRYRRDLENIQELVRKLKKAIEKSSEGDTGVKRLKDNIYDALYGKNVNSIVIEIGNINRKNTDSINNTIIIANNIAREISDYIANTDSSISNIKSNITGLESEKRNLYVEKQRSNC